VLVQVCRHVVPPQRKGEQLVTAPSRQAPAPLQVRAPVWVEPVQVWVPHGVPAGWTRQAPAPLQAPAFPQVLGVWAGHSPLGSTPLGTGVQVPARPGRLHE
jgi:hypothetical protein